MVSPNNNWFDTRTSVHHGGLISEVNSVLMRRTYGRSLFCWSRDPELAKKIGAAVALEVRATGIPYVFAPCVAVCRDPRWGRCYESFSEDPKLVQQMASVISGLQGEIPAGGRRGAPFVAAGQRNVAACSKYYAGDGGTAGGANEGDTAATFHDLLSVHMPPYYSAVVSPPSWSPSPAGTAPRCTPTVSSSPTSSKPRSDSGSPIDFFAVHFSLANMVPLIDLCVFLQGFVISDWGGIERITTPKGADYMLSIKLAIMAGIDMVSEGVHCYCYC